MYDTTKPSSTNLAQPFRSQSRQQEVLFTPVLLMLLPRDSGKWRLDLHIQIQLTDLLPFSMEKCMM